MSISGHHRSCRLKKTSLADPLGVLSVFLAVATTEVRDIDGGPLGVLAACLTAATIKVEDIDSGPPGGAGGMSGSGHHQS
jgi:hypothetical protein